MRSRQWNDKCAWGGEISYAAAEAVAHLAEGTERGDHKVRRL